MRRSEVGFQAALLLSRWLIAPFLIGLVCCLALLLYRFFADFYEIASKLPSLGWHDLVVEVLNLIDVSLTGNLVLIVVVSGYANFVRKIAPAEYEAWPIGLADVDFFALKQRILGTIVIIAAIEALAWYLDLEKYTDTSKLGWALAFPLMLVVATLMLALADRLGRPDRNSG
jgi:uncharacterized protein (TIGR00645 family)